MRIGPFGIPEIIIILLVVMLIFGAKRLPEIGSSLGKSIRTFKSAVPGEDDTLGDEASKTTSSSRDDAP